MIVSLDRSEKADYRSVWRRTEKRNIWLPREMVTTNEQELTIDGTSIKLPTQIETVLQIKGLIVVLLETTGRSPAQDNVWAFDMDGNLVWKAEPVVEPSNDVNTYVQIRQEGGDLWASDWKGRDYKLDLQNGKQIEEKFGK